MLKRLSKKEEKKSVDNVSKDIVFKDNDTKDNNIKEEIAKDDSSKKIKLFNSIAKYSIYILIALLPIFFLPTSLIELGQVKIGLLLLSVIVTSISLGLSAIYSGGIKLISKKVLIPVILISFLTFISSIFSTSYKDGLLGLGNEIDSWFLISIFLIATILTASVVNTRERIFTAFSLFWASFGIASLFQLFRLLAAAFKIETISTLLSLGGLFDLTELNTVGTWADFGIVAGFSALSLAITLDMVPLKKLVKNTAWFIFSISALMAFIASSIVIGSGIDQLTNSSQFIIPSMSIVGLVALFFAIFQLIKRRKEQKTEGNSIKFPIASFILICLGIITLASPLAINQKINSSIGIPNESVLNIRPGFSDTYQVSKAVVGSSIKNSLIGVGPHGFYIAWNKYRPAYINDLDLWSTDYQFGVGYLPTNIINNGILGFLSWIVGLIILFVFGIKLIFRHEEKDSSAVYTNMVVVSSALLLWINAIINISGSMVVILTFIITGLLLSSLVLDKKINVNKYSFEGIIKNKILRRSILKNKVFAFVIIILIILLLSFTAMWVERMRSQVYSIKAMHMIYAKNVDISVVPKAMELLKKAFDIYPSDVYARSINNLALVQISYDISSDPTGQNTESLQKGELVQMSPSTSAYMDVAITSGKSSVDANPNDFRNLLQFGSTMQTVALLTGDQDSGKLALQSFMQAENLARNHPLPLYSIANLYALAGDKNSAKIVLEQTLKIKPNFTEASDLYQKILQDISTPVVIQPKATSTKATSTKTTVTTKKTNVKSTTTVKKNVKPVTPVIKKTN